MRTTAILSTIVLSAGLLAGCGGGGDSSSSGYCGDLKDAKEQFDTLGSSNADFTKFGEAIDTFHELADEAPSDIEAEWTTLDQAFRDLEDGLEDAGLTLEDVGKITSGQNPENLTQEELAAALPKLQAAFATLDNEKFEKAADEIQKHAKSECDLDLEG